MLADQSPMLVKHGPPVAPQNLSTPAILKAFTPKVCILGVRIDETRGEVMVDSYTWDLMIIGQEWLVIKNRCSRSLSVVDE